MKKGTLALLIHGGTENWSPERWKRRFNDVCADRPVWVASEQGGNPADVHYAAVWKPAPGELASFPNLRVIFNLGAGVDALMADKTLPKVPLVRVSVGDLTGRMTEYVVLHVLMHHRQERYLRDSQREKRWQPKYQWSAGALTVGVMGLGTWDRMRRKFWCGLASRSSAGAIARRPSKASNAFTAKHSSMRFCAASTFWSAFCRSRRIHAVSSTATCSPN